MFIHFEDWSAPLFLAKVAESGLPHLDRIMKAYTTYQDPRELIDRPELRVFEVNHLPFEPSETFHYEGRESYTGIDIETRLQALGLQTVGQDIARALFRLGNREDFRFSQDCMAYQEEDRWRFNLFEDMHKLAEATSDPRQEPQIHLDIFFPDSIARLRRVINIDDSTQVLSWKEHGLLDKALTSQEGQIRHKER